MLLVVPALIILFELTGFITSALAFATERFPRPTNRITPKISYSTAVLLSTPEMNSVVDEQTMDETYDKLAEQAVTAFRASCVGSSSSSRPRLWIACCGAPGSGKTTVAQNLVERIGKLGPKAISIPMDGYHFTQKEMKEKGYGMKRRGAPWTFDATRMYNQLKDARDKERSDVFLPDYSREISDPVPGKIKLEESHDIVIIEGLYLALGALSQDLDTPDSEINRVSRELGDEGWIRDELKRWEPMMQLWDQTMFVEPPFGFEENKRRLVERSLKTWTPAKTELWLPGATDREAATKRVELNDERNAKLINCCKQYATFVVQNK